MASNEQVIENQKELCGRVGAEWFPSQDEAKIALSKGIKSGSMPINGLRHLPENEMAGWYIWEGGEINNDPEKWDVMHVRHLEKDFSLILKYLGLPPGYRFQIDDKGYEDIWYDESLLKDLEAIEK